MIKTLAQHFLEDVKTLPTVNTLWLAYSGGLDSSVLLHMCKALKDKLQSIDIKVIHINHGLYPEATIWQKHCEDVCISLGMELKVVHVDIPQQKGLSIEEQARQSRLHVFEQFCSQTSMVVTAHHQDDQAETVLLQLFRGCGLKGLSAMPRLSQLGKGYLYRPFLSFSRCELKSYATQQAITWVDDHSNEHLQFDRNYLRHKLMPLIAKRWPGVSENINRTAKHSAKANRILNKVAENALSVIEIKEDPNGYALSIPELIKLELDEQKNVLRVWFDQLKLPLPSTKKLDQLIDTVVHAKEDANPLLCWPGVEIRRFRGRLYAMKPLLKHDPNIVLNWDHTKSLTLPNDLGTLSPTLLESLSLPYDAKVTVQFRKGGERCRLKGRGHSHSLKKLFQVWSVPPWMRDRLPLVYIDETLACIPNYVECELIS